jgi:hypothetical protein
MGGYSFEEEFQSMQEAAGICIAPEGAQDF